MFHLRRSWPGKRRRHPLGVTRGVFSPYRTCSLGLHASTERANTTVRRRRSPAPAIRWHAATSTRLLARRQRHIAAPAVNCEAQVIVRGADRQRGGTSVERTPPPPPSLADWARFGRYGQCICHDVSTPCSSPLWPLAGVKSFIFLFISGLRSHSSRGQRPPSIIPMGEGVRKGRLLKGKYILI